MKRMPMRLGEGATVLLCPSIGSLHEFARLLFPKMAARADAAREREGRKKKLVRRVPTPGERARYGLDVALARMAIEIIKGGADLERPYRDLCELSHQLDALNEGIVGPALRPHSLNHRPSLSREQLVTRRIVAACYDALRTIGETRPDAERHVLALLREADLDELLVGVLPRGGVRGATVYKWWKQNHRELNAFDVEFEDAIARRSRAAILGATKTIFFRFFRAKN